MLICIAHIKSYEKTLLQALYGYIRAGQLKDAIEVFRQAHQLWWAAKHTWVSPLSMESTLYIITNVHCSPTLTIPPKIATMQCEDSTVDEDDLEPEAWSETTITNYRKKPAYMQYSM